MYLGKKNTVFLTSIERRERASKRNLWTRLMVSLLLYFRRAFSSLGGPALPDSKAIPQSFTTIFTIVGKQMLEYLGYEAVVRVGPSAFEARKARSGKAGRKNADG